MHCAIGSVCPNGLPNGTVGALRPATDDELRQIEQRVRGTRWLKGNHLLWSSFTQVRDMQFTSFRSVNCPVMMAGLWSADA